MSERKYLPTFADLVDRLSIVMLKSVFIPENRQAYLEEMRLIEHDIDGLLLDYFDKTGSAIGSMDIRAIMVVMLANRFIWENESKAREGSSEQNDMLRVTHAINGARNTAKNVLSKRMDERIDLKVDCLAENLPTDLAGWRLFDAR